MGRRRSTRPKFRKSKSLVLLALLLGGGVFLYSHYQIEGLEQVRITRRAEPLWSKPSTLWRSIVPEQKTSRDRLRDNETIRVASFNIQVFGNSKLNKTHVMKILAQVVREFDVVAIQEVRSKSQQILPRFVDLVNVHGVRYAYAVSPRLGRTVSKEQYAFVYDTATVELDQQSLYVVQDRYDMLHREPFVAQFRVRGPPPGEAFTFILVNIHTDPDEVTEELNVLDDVFREVRQHSRREDDIILLGDLNADDRHFGELGQIPDITCAISGVPSNTRGTKLYDNILFRHLATTEYTGRSGVLNLRERFGLTLDQALEVSDHCPVWAEFRVFEGGRRARVTQGPRGPRRR